jgi:hypothetical protein
MLGRILYGYKATQCLYVAAKLNIADYLKSGQKTINELSISTNTKPEPLYRVMRCLASLSVFQEDSNKNFSLNKNAERLLSDAEDTMKNFIVLCGEELYHSAGDLLYTVKTGLPAFDHIYGMNHWEYLEANPDKAQIFHDAMEKGTIPTIKETIGHYDFSAYRNIIDVGGGKGQLLCEILSQYPNAHGAVFDLANAKNPALEYIDKKELSHRCKVETGNFFISVPAGADIYLLKFVLHDWDDESANLILNNCRKGMTENSKLLIIEKIIDDNQFKDMACLGDINMLVTLTGKERSLAEFQKLLNAAGLKFERRVDSKTVFSIIEATVL